MKRILLFIIGMFLSLTAQSAVIYQSNAYGAGRSATSGYCSNCDFADNQYIGEAFSTTAAYSISSLDFYAQAGYAGPGGYTGSGDLSIAFFDAPESLVYFQTFSLAKQTKTDIDAYTINISVTFNPFQLAAGNYAVFFFGQDLRILAYDGFGSTQLVLHTSNGFPISDPSTTFSSSAIRLSGTPTAVPEPESLIMLLTGLGLLAVAKRRAK